MPLETLTAPKPAVPAIQTYAALMAAIRKTIHAGKRRAQLAVEKEKVRTSWKIGKLINEHILLNNSRARYGAQVIKRLSAELEMSETELKYMRQFAVAYPIGRAPDQLTWAHIETGLAVNEPEARETLLKKAVTQKWSSKALRREIKKMKAAKQVTVTEKPVERLAAGKGTPDTYRIVEQDGELKIDLGFSCYLALTAAQAVKLKAGDIVRAVKNSREGFALTAGSASENDLFTYRGTVLEITDGDTLWMIVDLGFGISTKQQLRLRAIDAPEITSAAGEEAKTFLASSLQGVLPKTGRRSVGAGLPRPLQSPPILLRTVKSDKYDRYLADLFIPLPSGVRNRRDAVAAPALSRHCDPAATAGGGGPSEGGRSNLIQYEYLNQSMLDHGHAVRVEE